MKCKKIRGKYGLAILMTATMLSGCGVNEMYEESAVAESATEDSYEETAEQEVGYEQSAVENTQDDTAQQSVSTNRKLIKTIELELETLDYETTIAYLEKSVNECGGYIESSSLEGNGIYSSFSERYGSFTVRIPKDKEDSFMQGMDDNTNVRRKSESTEDITLQYVDTESHKEALKVEQERLMAILEKAETVEEIISLESRLSEVRYEMGKYESSLRTYDNLVDYSTIRIEVCEVKEITQPPKKTAGERMISGFKNSVKNVGTGMKEFIIGLVINLPYLVVWAFVIGAVAGVVRAWKKRRKKGTDKGKQE